MPEKLQESKEAEQASGRYEARSANGSFTNPYFVWDTRKATYHYNDKLGASTFVTEQEASEFANHLNELEKRPALDRAKEFLNQYCQIEWQHDADFDDLSKVAIGYTTLTDNEVQIQCYANLVDFRIERYLEDMLYESRQYDSLEDLLFYELEDMTFDDLIAEFDEDVMQFVAENADKSASFADLLKQAQSTAEEKAKTAKQPDIPEPER